MIRAHQQYEAREEASSEEAHELAHDKRSSTRDWSVLRFKAYDGMRILVVSGPDAGAVLEGSETPIVIGTSPDSDLVLGDDTVSRKHCEITLTEEGFRVRDLASTNGVLVDNTWVHDALFTDIRQINLGATALRVIPLAHRRTRSPRATQPFSTLLGESAAMKSLRSQLARIAESDISLLVEGETGTGKELVAESVHAASSRWDQPFVVCDCGGISATQLELELCGFEQGAFAGANVSRAGIFEQANGGTIFFDEVADLEPNLQARLLRVLHKQEVKRLGSSSTIPIDVRIISATSRDLRLDVQRGRLREDLYFRVAGAHVRIPPLRERLEDLECLTEHFLRGAGTEMTLANIAEEVWSCFLSHSWPGNVRELQNAVERLSFCPTSPIPGVSSEPPRKTTPGFDDREPIKSLREARRCATDDFERAYVRAVLDRAGGNISRAATIAEVSRQMIQRLVRKHRLPTGGDRNR